MESQAKIPRSANPASQDRSRKTAQDIAVALEKLLRDKPFDSLTVKEIALAAGISPGTIYRRYKNKSALLPIVYDQYEEAVRSWMAITHNMDSYADCGSLREALEIYVGETWKLFIESGHLFRTIHIHNRLTPSLRKFGSPDLEQSDVANLPQILALFSDEISREPDAAARFFQFMLTSMLIERVLYREHAPSRDILIDDTDFIEELILLAHSWLTAKR